MSPRSPQTLLRQLPKTKQNNEHNMNTLYNPYTKMKRKHTWSYVERCEVGLRHIPTPPQTLLRQLPRAAAAGGRRRKPGRNRFGSIRFDSGLFGNSSVRLSSVRFGKHSSRFDAVRPARFGHVVARSGSVRFGSASASGRFRNYSVQLGSAESVSVSCSFLESSGAADSRRVLTLFASASNDWPRALPPRPTAPSQLRASVCVCVCVCVCVA